jgi:hypothetical protein
VGLESKQLTNEVNLYEVSVVADIQVSLTGCLNVYAANADEAAEKVQSKIEDETLDDDLEMEDPDSGCTTLYGNVKWCYGVDFQVASVEVIEPNADPFDVLDAEVQELESQVSWNTDSLAKHKAFLESLLNEGDDTQAVAA